MLHSIFIRRRSNSNNNNNSKRKFNMSKSPCHLTWDSWKMKERRNSSRLNRVQSDWLTLFSVVILQVQWAITCMRRSIKSLRFIRKLSRFRKLSTWNMDSCATEITIQKNRRTCIESAISDQRFQQFSSFRDKTHREVVIHLKPWWMDYTLPLLG